MIDVVHSDGRPPSPPRLYPKGSICLISLVTGAAIAVQGQFDALVVHIPRKHLSELGEKTGQPCVGDLTVCRGMGDTTVRDIGAALLPLIGRDDVDRSLVAQDALKRRDQRGHDASVIPSPLERCRVQAASGARLVWI